MYNKQQYKNVRHQATRRAQKWLKKLRHLDAIQVLFVSVANESPVLATFSPHLPNIIYTDTYVTPYPHFL